MIKAGIMKIYLDNAATTQLDPEVFKAMTPYLLEYYGNPSSQHQHGREAKEAIEKARTTIAGLLNASPSEIIFTGGGTEADNIAIQSAVVEYQVKRVITTPIEHHAVLHTLENLQKKGVIKLHYLTLNGRGEIDLNELDELLKGSEKSFVSVMHANNEIGNINDIEGIAKICQRHDALFHTDTVQTVGHYCHDLEKLGVHFIACSAHKFHGPKGVGFLYCRKGTQLSKIVHGGSQEKQQRAGTENIPGIVGMAKALEVAYREIGHHRQYIQGLKDRLITQMENSIQGVSFNGNSAIADKSLYTVLSINLPDTGLNLLRYLDENSISVSGGSACSTGSASHVLQAIKRAPSTYTIRFSFSKFNTEAEIDRTVEILSAVYKTIAA